MSTSSNRSVVAFNKGGDLTSCIPIPTLLYLKKQDDWIDEGLLRSPELDGIVLVIDWDLRDIRVHRNAKDD